jgi:L-amino acid N-acyltransferase YncA
MNLSFEKMTDEYLQFVCDVYAFYVVNSTATFHMHVLAPEEMRELVYFKDPRHGAFIMRTDGILCGYATLRHFSVREAYSATAEVGVYLKPEFIGKGLGTRALRFLEDSAKANGIHVLIASICAENKESIRLFERNGYKKCARFREVGFKFGRLLDVVDYQKILG